MSRRSENSFPKMKKDFSKLRELRENRQTNIPKFEDDVKIYDEISEHEYNKISKRAMLDDDFVEDDFKGEYTGLHDWEHASTDSEAEFDVKPKDKVKVEKNKKKKRRVIDMFQPKKEVLPEQDENQLLNGIFNELETEVTIKKEIADSRPKKTAPESNFMPDGLHSNHTEALFGSDIPDIDMENIQIKTELVAFPEIVKKEIRTMKNVEHKFKPEFKRPVPIKTSSQSNKPQDWKKTATVEMDTTTDQPAPVSVDGPLEFYYMDAFEKNGVVYLFGKVNRRSCCLQVRGIERNLYLLPREGQGVADVYNEFDETRRKLGISSFKSKPVVRNYAFEEEIPFEAEYLKISYPFDLPVFTEKEGKSFSHVFGAETKALELLILKRKLMGPCWLQIDSYSQPPKKLSFCATEFVTYPKSISVIEREPPELIVMSLNIRTVMNEQKTSNEIVLASILTYSNVKIDTETTSPKGSQTTIIRKLKNTPWPLGFEEHPKENVQLAKDEQSLLSMLCAQILRTDPDIIIGHNIIDYDLDILLQRMKVNRISQWSSLGRLKRTEWPKLQKGPGGMSDSSFEEKAITSGRLWCCTFRASKDYLQQKSYGLTQLAQSLFSENRPGIEYNSIGDYFLDKDQLLDMLSHARYDVHLVMRLCFKLQVIPLTKQLTALSGNLWVKTMQGARSDRNEYLLLHEFHKLKYVLPNKKGYTATTNKRKKAAYAGGLVLEPKAGLYDKYVLLLDFNSLYPSIIQEYNICFTTVTRKNDDEMPDLPSDTMAGILPRLLKSLVDRRRQVKSLMKAEQSDKSVLATLDIRQKALKLTANSMYGCLGFVNSRFYAKQIAMLITAQGRRVLGETVDLAGEMGLEVVYGDTDSIMIATHSEDIKLATELGSKLGRAVNARYKLLEIEMDGLYKRLLLLKKKKYAGLSVTLKNGTWVESLETKGLDLVRRDWCDLSHDVSTVVLQKLFSDQQREETVNAIHEYLGEIVKHVRAGEIELEKFVVNKGLTKMPNEYPDAENQPHVQVALKMLAEGLSVRAGDTVPYVIIEGTENIAKRARHIDQMHKDGLQPDYEWYIANQVLPPVSRLCAAIEGTDNRTLAFVMGLDTRKYQQIATIDNSDILPVSSELSPAERFKDCDRWTVTCPECSMNKTIEEIIDSDCQLLLTCTCGNKFRTMFLKMNLKNKLREYMVKYLKHVVICDEPTCQTQTKFIGVYSQKCLMPRCNGLVRWLYGDKEFHTQLQYFESLFDINTYLKKHSDSKERINQEWSALKIIPILAGVVSEVLQVYARNWVDLGEIFGAKLSIN